MKLGIKVEILYGQAKYSEAVLRGSQISPSIERHGESPYAATRRAIVRAAAEIGKTL